MNITFVTRGLPFNGDTLNHSGLGGSETAVICMSRELAKLGHRVRVFCNCDRPGFYGKVEYQPRELFEAQAPLVPTDVLIASRFADALACQSYAGLRVFWIHDTIDNNPTGLCNALFQTDLVFALSDFHIKNYLSGAPMLEPLMWKTSNAVDRELLPDVRPLKTKGKLIYTSRPERGLLPLLMMLPDIWKRHPHVKLHVAGYSTGDAELPEDIQEIHRVAQRMMLAYGDRIVQLGQLPKRELYREISSSELMVYPTHFPEISCISAMEAQLCGTPIVTTDAFALSETVRPGCGVLIPGTQDDPTYAPRFVDAVCRLLEPDSNLRELGHTAYREYQKGPYTWDRVAVSWAAKFEQTFNARDKNKIYDALTSRGDWRTVNLLTGSEDGPTPVVPEYAESMGEAKLRFEKILTLIVSGGRELPKRILDLSEDEPAFGLFCSRALSQSQVELVLPATTPEDVRALYTLNNLEPVGTPSGLYDLVYVGDRLESAKNPQQAAEYAQSFLTRDGILAGGTRTNFAGKGGQYWNLDYEDLQSMFTSPNFSANFVPVKSTKSYPVGRWMWITTKGPVSKFDLKAKVRRTRPYQSLALCLIGKDVSEWVFGAIKSAMFDVDQIYYADTGSSDDSVDIVESKFEDLAHVVEIGFDNFSQARNELQSIVREDWILWLDCDERILNPQKLRKYLDTTLFNAFAIRQNHLQIDNPPGFDTPARLFRNLPHYKWTGLIHEHCEDTQKAEFDAAIYPQMQIKDADIAHFGYVEERYRRAKSSNRNMELLIRDVAENPQRMLTWVLVMRDYLNMLKWTRDYDKGPVRTGSFEHELLNAVVATFHCKFAQRGHRHYGLAFELYQEALGILGKCGVSALDSDRPPIEMKMSLVANVGGIASDRPVRPRNMWFVNVEECRAHLQESTDALSAVVLEAKPDEPIPYILKCELPDAGEILRKGVRLYEHLE